MEIDELTPEMFNGLPLVTEGESKEVRYIGEGLVAIRFKPTIYSYTHNRSGIIAGSETLRLRAAKALLPVLREAGIEHTYQAVSNDWVISRLVLQPELADEVAPFRPTDLTPAQLEALPRATPIEVVAKAVHSGTPKHRYYRFGDYPLRKTATHINPEAPYPEDVIRFDWRNPLQDASGNRLADEVMPESMADWFIDVTEAKRTALVAFGALRRHLSGKGLDLWDICFFIAEDGKTMFGEVSPDCLRVRATDGTSLDKDVWRAGGSSETVLAKWGAFVKRLETD